MNESINQESTVSDHSSAVAAPQTTEESFLPNDPIDLFLTPISDGQPQGISLKYDPVYGQIQEARRFEDARLSQGVWRTAFKKPDWPLAESLCEEALMKSKDLQLAGWLTESWTGQLGMRGLRRGLCLLTQLVTLFWPSLYPQGDDQDEDNYEYRIRILEWLDNALSDRLLYVSLTSNPDHKRWLNLTHWMDAIQLEKVVQRSADKTKVLAKATADKQVTTAFFKQELSQTDADFLRKKTMEVDDCVQKMENLIKVVDSLSNRQCPSFKKTIDRLQDIKRITHTAWENNQKRRLQALSHQDEKKAAGDVKDNPMAREETLCHEKSLSNADLAKNRADAYAQLAVLTDNLEKSDPQGVVPLFLRQLLNWQGLTLIEFLQNYGQTPENMAAFINLLGRSPVATPSALRGQNQSFSAELTALGQPQLQGGAPLQGAPAFPGQQPAASLQSRVPQFQFPPLKR